MTLGTFELDDEGRRLFRPDMPSFPRLDDIHDLLEPTVLGLRDFDLQLRRMDRQTLIGRLFARLDAVHSSGAEGATTTFTDLMDYESSLRVAPDVNDAASVAAVAEELTTSFDHDDLSSLILKIHRRLFEADPDLIVRHDAGHFKARPNFTRDTDEATGLFGYTKPASVAAALSEWQQFTMATGAGQHELTRQILSHWMFEHIHPVTDGNGRIGRLLVPIVLKAKGFSGTACAFFGEAVHEDKWLYIEALKQARVSGDVTSFTRRMLGFIGRTARANLARLDQLQTIEARWKTLFKNVRSDSAVHKLIAYAATKPVFTVNDAQNDLKVSFATANEAARALLAEGVLSIVGRARRDRLFHADEILNVFDRFRRTAETGEPS